jgi:hypothetical protein
LREASKKASKRASDIFSSMGIEWNDADNEIVLPNRFHPPDIYDTQRYVPS